MHTNTATIAELISEATPHEESHGTTRRPDYTPPTAGPNDLHNGLGWRDMPGTDEEVRRMNFSLYRRGLYDPHKATRADARAAMAKHFHG